MMQSLLTVFGQQVENEELDITESEEMEIAAKSTSLK